MTTARSTTALHLPRATSRLATALEILTVAATLALGAAFVGSLWPEPRASGAEMVNTCAPGSASS